MCHQKERIRWGRDGEGNIIKTGLTLNEEEEEWGSFIL